MDSLSPEGIPPVWEPATDLIQQIRDIGRRILSPGIEERFLAGEECPAATDALIEAGLYRLTIPVEHGGLGRSYTDLAAVCEELGAIDSSYQVGLTVHLGLVAMTVLQWGNDRQIQEWLPQLVTGQRLATFGLTEPGAGSDVAAIQMRARTVDGGYLLNGEKTWISCASTSSLYLIFATTDPAQRHRGISCFIVDRESTGLSVSTMHGKLGMRAGDTGSISCQDVFVSGDRVLGNVGEGFVIALSSLGHGLFTVGAGALGIAAECRRITASLLRELGEPGGSLPAAELARMVAREEIARLLIARAADLKNRGQLDLQATRLAKWQASEAGFANAASALTIYQELAGPENRTLARHLANVKGAVIFGGTSEIHQTMQAGYALGYITDRPFRRPPLAMA